MPPNPAATSAPTYSVKAREAINRFAGMYVLLTKTAREEIAKAKAEKRKIPIAFVDGYHRAVNEYLVFGRQLIESLGKQRLTLEQVVLDGAGKPVIGPDGQAKTIRVLAPLRPPIFPIAAGAHPTVARVSGSMQGAHVSDSESGLLPLLLAPVVIFAVKAILITGVAVVVGKVVLDALILLLRGYPPPDMEKAVAAFKAAGFTPQQSLEALKQQGADFAKAKEGSGWTGLLMGGIAIAGLVIVVPHLMKKGA